jgi:adhesin/invasin
MMFAARRIRRASWLLTAALLLSCKDTPTTNQQQARVPASLDIVAGDEQNGVVGTELTNPLVVRVEDANGLPIVGQLVNFRVTSGGGSVFAGSGLTNALGVVQDRWTLGTSTADSQRVEARAIDPNTGARIVFATFKATPLPGPAQLVTKIGGDAQTGALGAALTDSLAVRVADSYGNPVPGVTVAWAASAGNGAVGPATSQTNAQGIAKTRWTLGARMDVPHSVTATVATLAPATFSVTPTLPASARIVRVAGEGATATVGTALGDSLAVRVELASGAAVAGATVTWTVSGGGGSVSPGTSTTQADGVARARLTLGTGTGSHTVMASVPNLAPATITVTGAPDVPASVTKTAGDGQTGIVAEQLSQSLTVRVVDRYGNAAPNVGVAWNASAGTVTPSSPLTNAAGEATAAWTLGQAAGSQTVSATASGLPAVQFGAMARAAPVASLVVVGGAGQSAPAGSELPTLIDVQARDRFGNAVSDVSIAFAASDGGTFWPASATTDASGRASSRWTLGATAGTQTATLSSGGVSTTTTASATTGSAALLTIVSGNTQAGIAGDPLGNPLVVRVTDASSNPVSGVSVGWTVGSQCGSIGAASTTTDAAGMAQNSWTLGPSGRGCAGGVSASIAGGPSVQFTARFLGRTAQVIDPGNFVEQVGTIDVPVVLIATVTDNAENPVPGVAVSWSRTEGNGALATMTSVTDSFGRASATFTPGTLAGNNRVLASVTGLTGAEYLVWTRALAAERIVIVDGNNQTGEPGQALVQPIRVRVEDQYGNGVYDQPISFQVTSGGGHVERTTLRTDAAGLAATVWVPGSVGVQQATATWNGTQLSFTATSVEGTREGLIIAGGNEQTVTINNQQECPCAVMSVRVVNGRGEPVSGVPVTWVTDISQTVVSDAAGLSTLTTTRFYLNGVGVRTLTARLPNGTVVQFAVIVQSSGGGAFGAPQHTGPATARVGRRLPGRVVVFCSYRLGGQLPCSARTRDGNFQTPGYGGLLIPAPGIFPVGHYEFFWILPNTPGTYYVDALGSFLPNSISATAVP